MLIRPIQKEDIKACLEIYAPFVNESAVSFELVVPTITEFNARVEQITQKYPWLVAVQGNEIMGYAYASSYRDRLAYQWNVEVSVYVHDNFKQKKVGQTLYLELMKLLKTQGFCRAFAVIAIPNEPSVKFHTQFGFKEFAVYEKVGFKLDQWHDVLWMQYEISHPEIPSTPLLPSSLK
jgi:L-amino acid N-acyltransferase YncA